MTTTSRKTRFLILTLTGCLLPLWVAGNAFGAVATGLVGGLNATASMCGQVRSITDRRTADGLLKRARQALDEGNLELTEWYVSRAEGMEVVYDSVFERFVDTPEKVREAMTQYRANVPQPINTAKVAAAEAAAMNAATGQITDSAKLQATSFLNNGRAALASGDIDKAIGWYQSAVATGASFDRTEYSPEELAIALGAYGVDASKITGAATSRIPAAEMVDAIASASLMDPAKARTAEQNSNALLQRGSQINATASDQRSLQREQTLKLLAQAELALDRGELAAAEKLAVRAQNIKLPDEYYEAGETRPWAVLMEIGRQQGLRAANVTQNLAAAPPTPSTDNLTPPTGSYATQTSPAITAAPAFPYAAATAPQPGVQPAIPNTQTMNSRNAYASSNQAPAPAPMNAFAQNLISAPVEAFPPANTPILSNAMLGGTAPTPPSPILGGELSSPVLPSINIAPPPYVTPQPTAIRAPNMDDLLSDLGATTDIGQPTPAKPTAQPQATTSPPAPVAVADVDDLKPMPIVESPAGADDKDNTGDEGAQLFRDGEIALKKHDYDRARALFREAWSFENDLPPSMRQRLQDYLQSTQPSQQAERQPAPPKLLADRQPVAEPVSTAEQKKVRALIDEMSRQQATINAVREKSPLEAWDKIKVLRQTVAESEVETATRERLLARVDRAMKDMETYIDANRSRIENDRKNAAVIEEVDRRREQRLKNQEQLAEFVEQFNDLIDQQRFPEANIVAKRAAEIDPLNPVVETMLWKAQVARQVSSNMARISRGRANTAQHLSDIDGTPMVGEIEFPDKPAWESMSRNRRGSDQDIAKEKTEAEMEIDRALKQPVDVKFVNQPIAVVTEKLSQLSGVNIFLDPEGLTAEGVTSDTTVSLNLRKPVSLKSALNLILAPLHLSYVVQNEVLQITSEQVRDGDVYTRTYNVADLVIPIPNFDPSTKMGLPAALQQGYEMARQVRGNSYQGGYRQVPYVIGSNDSSAAGNQNVLAQLGGFGGSGPQMGMPMAPQNVGGGFNPTGGMSGAGGAAMADFDSLIELVTTTVSPESWEEVGGTGTVAPFPTNLSLVVAQTQEIHEKIVDLLAQLRRLQDLQVTIEVRFITLNDDFFERMGVDFDFEVDDNTGLSFADTQALDDSGPSITVGLDPVNRIPTVDLDVGFSQGSFAAAVPAFGGFDAASAASVGFAILSDIEAFFVIEAAQGDTRTNVLQAPKVTLFNGQQAFISDSSQRPFVTSIIPVVGDFAAAHQPVITVLTEGTSLSVQAVVSSDRRFVRLTLVPFFSRIGDVDTFTFDGNIDSDTGTNVIDPTDDTNNVVNNARQNRQGTTVQLPTFSFTSVTTTVSVPDGGTILLGGIKRLTEGRTERGVPMLSKLPYINRLFANVGIGRETESLMMMVTPRIIIQEEEEEKLGVSLP